MEKIRAFIAIELPPEVKQAITRLQNKLKNANEASVRWVNADAIHLTLQFLGDVDVDITGKIAAAIQGAVSGIEPFHVEVSGLGVFPDSSRVRVVWVGLGGEIEKLAQLQKRIEIALIPLGFTPESRPFTAHLTMGRVRDNAGNEERRTLGQLIEKTVFKDAAGLDVKTVHLIKSQLTPQGPIYTKISSAELK